MNINNRCILKTKINNRIMVLVDISNSYVTDSIILKEVSILKSIEEIVAVLPKQKFLEDPEHFGIKSSNMNQFDILTLEEYSNLLQEEIKKLREKE